MMFADVPGMSFWAVIEHIALVATIAGTVAGLVVARRKKEKRVIEPDPLRVKKYEPKANDSDCKARYTSVMARIDAVARENTEEHQRLYDQIDVVERRSEDRLNKSMADVGEIIRKMPAEIISLLNDTGQLKNHHD